MFSPHLRAISPQTITILSSRVLPFPRLVRSPRSHNTASGIRSLTHKQNRTYVSKQRRPGRYRTDVLLTNLLKLAEERHEVMFIVSQLGFGSYLNKPSYAAAVSCLPKPTDLNEEYRRGDFDILIIHRHYGVLVGEVKSVGIASHTGVRITRRQEDAAVIKRLQKAVKQLDKSDTVVRHLLSDLSSGLTVRKTIFLPILAVRSCRGFWMSIRKWNR